MSRCPGRAIEFLLCCVIVCSKQHPHTPTPFRTRPPTAVPPRPHGLSTMASKRKGNSSQKKQGEFAGKWIRYNDLLQEVQNDDTVKTLRKQMFRFGLFFPLVMANVLISSQIAAEFDISNALTETLINEDFIRPVAANAPDSSAGYMKFDDIASKDHFWAVSTLVVCM